MIDIVVYLIKTVSFIELYIADIVKESSKVGIKWHV